jgi:hypothetical protein
VDLTLSSFCTKGNSNLHRTKFDFEIGGNAGQYAFNYGRLIYQKRAFKVIGSVGFSLWQDRYRVGGSTIWYPVLPLELSALIGRRKHHLEFGLGITPYLLPEINFSSVSGTFVQTKGPNFVRTIVPIRVGYRYQKPDGDSFLEWGTRHFLACLIS